MFVCQKDGKFAYSPDLKDWYQFQLSDIKLVKISAGSTYVLGATECGHMVVLEIPKDGGNVLEYDKVELPNADSKVVEVLHLALCGDDCALAVVKAKSIEDGNLGVEQASMRSHWSKMLGQEGWPG